MRIGFFQFQPIFGDKKANLQKITQTLSQIKADLIVLPELCNTGYSFKNCKELFGLSEKIPDGETSQTLLTLAQKKNLFIIAGLAEKEKSQVYNSAILVTPDQKAYTYRKAHLFFEEKFIFNRGNTKFRTYQCNKIKIGIIICFDYIFPEASRTLALAGAQIICHPSNLILPYAQKMTITRAIENRVFFIMANRIGTEKRTGKYLKFNGRSQIISPTGDILAKAGSNQEAIKIVDINPDQALDKYVTKYNNVWSDRRTDLYYK